MKANLTIVIVILVMLGVSFYGGNRYYKNSHTCPEIASDTSWVYDTGTRIIKDSFPYYLTKDSIIFEIREVPFDVDTNEILKLFFAEYEYTRTWKDSLVSITLIDKISQNKSIKNKLSYELLQPQQLINNLVDNSVTNYRYITGGIRVPLNAPRNTAIGLNYINQKMLIGADWTPYDNTWQITLHRTLFKWKKTK